MTESYDSTPSPPKVLLVDDEEDILMIFADLFKDWFEGCAVDIAVNGKIAKTLIKENKYQLISTDYRMPQCTGRELIEWIRSSDNLNSDTPIVLITSFPFEVKETVAKYGVHVSAKPIDHDELFKTTKHLIENQKRKKSA